LKEPLGGNCKTSIIITLSPSIYNVDETRSTLEFGQKAKKIINNAEINKTKSIAELEALLDHAHKRIGNLEEELNEVKKQ